MAPCVEWNVGFWTKVSGTQTPKNLNVITIVHYVIKVSIMYKAFVGKFYKKKKAKKTKYEVTIVYKADAFSI